MGLTLDFMGREFAHERNLYGYVKWTIKFVNTHLTDVLISFCTILTIAYRIQNMYNVIAHLEI